MAVKPNSKKAKAGEIPLSSPQEKPELTAMARAKMPDFIEACNAAGVKPTKRQAAKYNAKMGRWA